MKKGISVTLLDSNEPQRSDLIQSPHASRGEEFASFLRDLVYKFKIQRIVACSDMEIRALSVYWQDKELAEFQLPSSKSLQLFQDKLRASEVARNFGIKIPRKITADQTREKYFIKDRFSFTRPKTHKIGHNWPPQESENFLNLEFIDGPEYSLDTFLETNNEVLHYRFRERLNITNGVALDKHFVNELNLQTRFFEVIREHKLYGFACSQFIKSNENFYFIETNPRPGGGTYHSLEDEFLLRLR